MSARLPRGGELPVIGLASAVLALGLLWHGVAELVARQLPEATSTLPSVFHVSSEDGPLAGLLLQASTALSSRHVGYASLVVASAALSWLGAFALGGLFEKGRNAWPALLLAALLTVGWADWRVLLGQWRALLAGGFISLGLALQARTSVTERGRGASTLASGLLFGLALLTRHAIWPALLPSLFWLGRGPAASRRQASYFGLGFCATCLAALALAVGVGAGPDYARWLLAWDWAMVPISEQSPMQLLSDAGLLSLLWVVPALPALAGAPSGAGSTSASGAARFAELAQVAWLLMFWPLSPFPSGGILTSLLALAPAFGCLLAAIGSRRQPSLDFTTGSIGELSATAIVSLLLLGRASALDFDAHRSPIERQADQFE